MTYTEVILFHISRLIFFSLKSCMEVLLKMKLTKNNLSNASIMVKTISGFKIATLFISAFTWEFVR